MNICVVERFARGKRVTSATKKVPVIASTRGKILLALSTGSSLMKNKIVIKARKQIVEHLDTASTANFHDAGSVAAL
jgi:hypothetical protein